MFSAQCYIFEELTLVEPPLNQGKLLKIHRNAEMGCVVNTPLVQRQQSEWQHPQQQNYNKAFPYFDLI